MMAWVTTSVGLFFRRRLLAVISAVLVGLQLWWVCVLDFDPVSHLAKPKRGQIHLLLFDANVSQSNRNLNEIAHEIADRPQVVTMEELTQVALRSLQSTHVMDRYHYSLVRPASASFGMALWSLYPLRDATEWYAFGHPELRAWFGFAWAPSPAHRRAAHTGPVRNGGTFDMGRRDARDSH